MVIKVFDSLPEAACRIRETVFVDEQGFTEEFDDLDKQCVHLLLDIEGNPVATCRFYDEGAGQWHVGRVAVLKEHRGKNYGAVLMRRMEQEVAARGGTSVVLAAQLPVKNFYEKLGYQAVGDVYLEQGYPHVAMRKAL